MLGMDSGIPNPAAPPCEIQGDQLPRSLTLANVIAAAECLQANGLKPRKVTTQDQAEAMTALDPAGHVWTIGERYHVLELRVPARG
jgi:hypothetical protein